jgi:hypothetical protein
MSHFVVGVDDLIVAEALFAILLGFGFGRLGGEGDALGVGGPFEAVDSLLHLGELLGLAALHGEDVDLALVFWRIGQHAGATGEEGDPMAVGGPLGAAAAGVAHRGQRVSFS